MDRLISNLILFCKIKADKSIRTQKIHLEKIEMNNDQYYIFALETHKEITFFILETENQRLITYSGQYMPVKKILKT